MGLVSCGNEELKKPDFILGYWNRTNNTPGTLTYEIWSPDFTGIGFTMQQRDTVFKELMSIVEINDTLVLKVEGVNEKPTLFKFTAQTETSFTCENPQNEFPKKIKYWIQNDTLYARVSNDSQNGINFSFLKSL
jgi:hypothetical protein